ncbi:MAG TPA: NCS2 family permease [Candidatus Blautia avistercoris]|uniref:NCS2 family permease n=1 Tax=Blautia sp. An249 TaxID=1965603 RepID=UPI000B372F12|nr:NCS2 family permease [Blautia sp. An249]OUO79353.1 guanine permease [Blautia sp. An249]HIY19871.1 NCS2 family permease [Candidatus Blautia avistercoris]
MEKFFKLKEHHTDVKTEVIAGITTFMTMAYILAVNPSMLSAAGMDSGAVFTATAVASAIASFIMAFAANLPFVLSAGMGLNAYFAYTVCLGMGLSWEIALTAVFVEGIIFIILSLTNVREAIFNAIPGTLKIAVSVGIGLFITFIGLQNANLIVLDESTKVAMFSFAGSIQGDTFSSEGITVFLAFIGILITAILVIKQVKGHILIGILITWILGIICQIAGIYVPNPEAGFYSLLPSGIFSMPASVAPTFLKLDFGYITENFLNFVVIMFAFLFVDMFDTLGTLIGCASKANMLDKDGKLPGIKGALFADALGTTVGACLGTSTITTFVESSSGIAEGGRTGLTSIVSGLFFVGALFLSPIFLTIPSFATAPALVIVGFLMMQQVTKIDFTDLPEAIPAFIAIFAMPFMYSISEGIALGVISYVVVNLACKNAKKITPLMYILAILFLLKYIFI